MHEDLRAFSRGQSCGGPEPRARAAESAGRPRLAPRRPRNGAWSRCYRWSLPALGRGGSQAQPRAEALEPQFSPGRSPRRPGQPRAGPACARSPRGGAAERWSARGRRWEARLPKAVFTWLAGSPGGGGGAAGAPGPRSSSQTAPPRQRGRACGPGDRGRDPEGGAGAPGPRALGARAAGGGPDPAAPAAWRDDRRAVGDLAGGGRVPLSAPSERGRGNGAQGFPGRPRRWRQVAPGRPLCEG